MTPLIAPHRIYVAPDRQAVVPEESVPETWEADGYSVLAEEGSSISVRAQRLYGLSIVNGAIESDGYHPEFEPREGDSGDIPLQG